MKKSLLLCLTVFSISFLSYAQPQKGLYELGGSVNFSYSKSSKNWYYLSLNSSISPEFGRFITDNLVLGGVMGYSFDYYKDPNSNPTSTIYEHGIGLGAYVTRYFGISDKFYFTITGSLYPKFGTQIKELGSVKSNTNDLSFTLSAYPGLSYFINSKLAVYCSVGNLYYTGDYFFNSKSMSNAAGLSLSGSSIKLGVKYYFGGSK